MEKIVDGTETVTLERDAAGRRSRLSGDGNEGCVYAYDFLNRTIAIDDAPGETCATEARYLHDPLSRPVVRVTGDDVTDTDLTTYAERRRLLRPTARCHATKCSGTEVR